MALSFLDAEPDIFSAGTGSNTLLAKKKLLLDEEDGGDGGEDFGGGDGGGEDFGGNDDADAQAAAAMAKTKADADAAAAAAQAEADAAAAAKAALTGNIFTGPSTTAPAVTTAPQIDAENIFGGVKQTVPTVSRGIVETGGTGTTTSTGTTADGNTLVEFKPPDNQVIGADGKTAGERAADLLREPLTTISQTQPTITLGGGGIFAGGKASELGGLTGNIPVFNLGGSTPSAGTSSVTNVPTTTSTPTETRPTTIEGFLEKGIKPTVDEMTGLIDQRLKAAQNVSKQLGGSGTLTGEEIDQVVNEVYDSIYKKEGGLQSLSTTRDPASQGIGIPAIIPIPGLDPTTAAIITAIGLIRSGGKVSTIDPNDPLGSLINIGKGIFSTDTGAGPGGPGGAGGGGTAGGTAGGATGTGTGATAKTPEELELERKQKADADAAAAAAANAQLMGILNRGDQARQDVEKANEAAVAAAAEEKRKADAAAAEEKRKADEAAAAAAAALAKENLPKPDDAPAEIVPVDTTPRNTNIDTCPSPETPILLSDGSQIPAGELQPGMVVRTAHEHTKEWGNYPVTRVAIVKDQRLRLLLNEGAFICSPTHKFSTGSGWKQAKDYRAGDALQHRTVISVEEIGEGDVVSITVDGAHTYVSDGLLSHNKTPVEVAPATGTPVITGTSISGGGTATASPNESTTTSSCPSPETPILLEDRNTIPAGDLKVGMKVMARLENQLVWGGYEVTQVKIVKDQRLKFTFDYGTFICSPTHKFCHNDWEWREAQSYSVGDEIQDNKILAIEDNGIGDVVVITVDEAHTYVAGPFLSHNKQTSPVITTVNTTNVPTTTSTSPTGGTFNVTVTGDQTPISYTAPKAGDPFQRSSWEEASTQLGMLNAPIGRMFLGYEKGPNGENVPVYSSPQGGTVGENITGTYGKMARGMTKEDIANLRASFGGLFGDIKEGQNLQDVITDAAMSQTEKANRALRRGNMADAAEFGMQAKQLRDMANAGLFGETGTLPQYTSTAQEQVSRDIAALRAAEAGQLSRESTRAAQQAAREAAGARGQVMSRGTAAQEVLNREAAIQQRQQQARQNLAQSMGQLGQGIGFQSANMFDPMAAALGQQYGMQTSNVGLNQALYNQAMGLASGQGGYGFAQQMVNPFSQYAADVYGTNVNARNAFMMQEANRLAALEAARMGEAAARNAANTKLALGGVDFLYKYGAGQGWWG